MYAGNGITGPHKTRPDNHSHHTRFAHKRTIGTFVEDIGKQAWHEVLNLSAGIAQARDSHDSGFANAEQRSC
jgi:hypothetical protein